MITLITFYFVKMNVKEILEKKEVPEILIIRQKPLGDTVLTTPVFYALKKTFPHSKITVIISKRFSGIIKNNPNIDEIMEYDRGHFLVFLFLLLFRHFDVSIDFINIPRSSLITLFAWARFRFGLPRLRNFFYNERNPLMDGAHYIVEKNLSVLIPIGIKNPPIQYYLSPTQEAKDFAAKYLKHKSVHGKIIGLYVSGSSLTQKWPLDKFLELGTIIIEQFEVELMILWGPEDQMVIENLAKNYKYAEIFKIIPPTSVEQIGAFIQKCSIIVTGDGGPKHMAVALDIPTLTIYGSVDYKYWNPPDLEKFPVISSDIHCSPCHEKKLCPLNTYECLHSISVKNVFQKTSQLARKYLWQR